MSRMWGSTWVCLLAVAVGCSKPDATTSTNSADTGESDAVAAAPGEQYEEFLNIDESTTPQEIKYLQAGKEFYLAMAGREYGRAYDMLSPYALQDLHPYQFFTPEDETHTLEPPRIAQLTKEDFVSKMQQIEEEYGPPRELYELWVQETDRAVLAGQGDRVEVMFAVGMIPESVPVDIRKCALRGKIRCRFNPDDLKAAMEETGMTKSQLEDDEDVFPYYSLKTVLVQENGKLAVGYLEFVGPSLLD